MEDFHRKVSGMQPESLSMLSRGPVAGDIYSYILGGLITDPETGQKRATDFFMYGQTFLPLLSGGTGTQDIQIQSDSDFLIFAAVALSRDPADDSPDADLRFTVQLTSSGSGRNLFDRAQDAENVFGTAQRPAWWPVPKILWRNSTFTVTLQDIRARDSDIRVGFWGFKVFLSTMGQ